MKNGIISLNDLLIRSRIITKFNRIQIELRELINPLIDTLIYLS